MRRQSSQPSNQGVTRVLIVDDHPLVRRGLKELIRHELDLDVCGEAEGVTDAKSLQQKLQAKSLPEATETKELLSQVREAHIQVRQLADGLVPIKIEGDLMRAL